ncbi:hypothetical protein B0H16DRAFT_1492190 [Mycena metata]|uniref:Uncharacterized protein n=1 Tax=Mycena metata TaxID=1033252 RepID=A0AAD7P228_9AGAR|nr:hypothetical protein B0H16DRAFT_1492190 [Mycena metata]
MFSRLKLGPRRKDLSSGQVEKLLSEDFPEMIQHVHELVLRRKDSISTPRVKWPVLPQLPALRRICISNAWSTVGSHLLLSSPSLVHFHVHSVFDIELPSMLAALPHTLKSLVLEKIGDMQLARVEDGLRLQAVAPPMHLESLTIEAFRTARDGSDLHSVLSDPRSRVVLSDLRHLAFITKNLMLSSPCSILRGCANALNHLEFRFCSEIPETTVFLDGFGYSTDPFFDQPLTSTFPLLRTITFIFPSAPHPAPISRLPGILTIANGLKCPSLKEVILHLHVRIRANRAWWDSGFPALDAVLSHIPTLTKVSVLIRIVTRGRHSIAEHSAGVRSVMPLTEARGILRIERRFPIY